MAWFRFWISGKVFEQVPQLAPCYISISVACGQPDLSRQFIWVDCGNEPGMGFRSARNKCLGSWSPTIFFTNFFLCSSSLPAFLLSFWSFQFLLCVVSDVFFESFSEKFSEIASRVLFWVSLNSSFGSFYWTLNPILSVLSLGSN